MVGHPFGYINRLKTARCQSHSLGIDDRSALRDYVKLKYTVLRLGLVKKVGLPETYSNNPVSSPQTPQGSVRSCSL